MADVTFSAPSTVEEAARALADEEAVAVAGGTSIGLLLRQRLIEPSALVSLQNIPTLGDIAVDASGRLQVGAAVTLARLSRDETVLRVLPALAKAASVVGNARVRSIATIGGAIAHADPRQDVPPVLTAFDTALETVDSQGARRTLPVRGFYNGLMDTALNEDELITQVLIPVPQGAVSMYERFAPGSVEDYPTVSVAIAAVKAAGGTLSSLDLGLGSVGSTPLHVSGAQLCNRELTAADVQDFCQHVAASTEPVSDRLGTDRYKRQVVGILAGRMLRQLLGIS